MISISDTLYILFSGRTTFYHHTKKTDDVSRDCKKFRLR